MFTAHPCADIDCQHDGHCDLDENYSPYCVCTYKYEGIFCENGRFLYQVLFNNVYEWYNIVCIRYSRITFSFNFIIEIECNLTCEHDGICAKDHNDDLQCFCPQGYSGQYCEHGKRISILDIPHKHTYPVQYSNENG